MPTVPVDDALRATRSPASVSVTSASRWRSPRTLLLLRLVSGVARLLLPTLDLIPCPRRRCVRGVRCRSRCAVATAFRRSAARACAGRGPRAAHAALLRSHNEPAQSAPQVAVSGPCLSVTVASQPSTLAGYHVCAAFSCRRGSLTSSGHSCMAHNAASETLQPLRDGSARREGARAAVAPRAPHARLLPLVWRHGQPHRVALCCARRSHAVAGVTRRIAAPQPFLRL